VAFRVCVGINRVSPATATSLVTFALLTTGDRALTLDQVADAVAPLAGYLDSRGVPVPVRELDTRDGLCETLDRLQEAQVVRMYAAGTEPVFSIEPGRHHVAAFYRNGALHHLVNRALAELATMRLSRARPGEDLMQLGWTYLWALRDLLKFEFFFSDKRDFAREVLAEVDLLFPTWRDRGNTPADAARVLRDAPLLVAHGTLRTYLDAQLVVAEHLAGEDPDAPVDRERLRRELLGLGRQLLLQRRLDRADSVSAELYDSALRLADNRGLVEPGGPDLARRRRAYRDEVRAVVDDLAAIGDVDTGRLERLLGAQRHGAVAPPAEGTAARVGG
jgi:glycerol-3-phosphate O-acyltransferase